MLHLDGIAPLSARYDGFIVDLWGVIHDGLMPYPGAIECLHRLRAAGGRVVLLSNAPRRSEAARHTLRRMGLPDDAYDGILTSGEATRDALLTRADPWFATLGDRVWHLGPDKDASVFEDLALVRVPGPEAGAFVLNTGPDDALGETDPERYLPELRRAADLGMRMVCANPDLVIVRGGQRVICAGLLARDYAAMGGEVRQIGKPHPEVYEPVRRMLRLPDRRILAIGDALATDIAGAAAAGFDSCWVLGGIHADAVGRDPRLAEAEARAAGLDPAVAVPRFVW